MSDLRFAVFELYDAAFGSVRRDYRLIILDCLPDGHGLTKPHLCTIASLHGTFILKAMARRSRLSPDLIIEVKRLYAEGATKFQIALWLAERGIMVHPNTVYYYLGLRKPRKPGAKRYIDYVREDCERRGVPFRNPRSRRDKLWS